ncbi:glycerol kinase [Microthyrium microscopicum]|uniref:glycerol kinase n=1 Tax=Microthyrium microscopicum TaxID=703497 RepID=A0A6A6UF76_9PEZI|nr:glycerol kinase [Microthyrium microscopicum]
MTELIGAIDQGTTSSRFLIFNRQGEPVAEHQTEFKQIYPNSGWHEHDPLELVSSVEGCIAGAVKDLEQKGGDLRNIKAVGITNQRETTVVWDTRTGEPLHNAIVWTDTRTSALVRELKTRPGFDALQEICGLPLSTYPSCSKLLWLLEHIPKVKAAYNEGRLAFGTVDSWLVYKLNGGPQANVHVSDPTNASRSMFMNLKTCDYDNQLLDFFKLDRNKLHLPKIVRSSCPDSYGKLVGGTLAGIPITGCLGDQSAALVGQKGFEPGRAKNTYGTGCFLLYNVGEAPVISKHGLLATVAYYFDGKPVYALEGSIAVAGSALKFLINNLSLAKDSREINELAAGVEDNGGVVFVTAFSGLFAPYWIDDVKGTLLGITQFTQKGHIARAALEAVCFQTKAILDAMEKDSGHPLQRLAVDGGMSNSELCMQTQADLISIPVDRPKMRETTALGAAIAAGLAVKVWNNIDELKDINTIGGTIYEPKITKEDSSKMFTRWEKAVYTSSGFV